MEQLPSRGDKHTGALIAEDKRKAILEALATGDGINTTAEKLAVSRHTVMAVRDAEIADNPRWAESYYRHRTPAKLLHIASKAMERMDAEMDRMPLAVLPVAMGVAIDKYLTLSGQATQVSEHRHYVSVGDIGAKMAAATEIQAEVVSKTDTKQP